ncbi:MAG TPA: VWA domain-containing protein, partial [Acidimicrobiia bacterium]
MEDFAFLAPARLTLLVLPLALLLGYLLVSARRRSYALRFTTIEMLDDVAPDKPGWRRHLPAIGLVLAVVVATLGFARPVIAGEATESSKLVILAIDTSISMRAADVSPSRIDAAREAAGVFLESVPEGVAVGVVAFDGSARQLIAPTTNLTGVKRIIDNSIRDQSLGEGTAIGEAVFLGIDAIEGAVDPAGSDTAEPEGPIGTIVLLSDGDTTMGRSNDEAASAARAAGVPVHTIAFGTDSGFIDDPLMGHVPVPVNEAALKELADQTGGQTLTAATADQLSDVYETLGQTVTVEREQV